MTRWNAAGCAASPCPPRSWSPTAAAAAPTFAGTAVTCAAALTDGPPLPGQRLVAPPPGHQPPVPPPPGRRATGHRSRQRRQQANGRPARQRRHQYANPLPNHRPCQVDARRRCAFVTICSATSRTGRLARCAARHSRSDAWSASQPWSAISTPLACSITGKLASSASSRADLEEIRGSRVLAFTASSCRAWIACARAQADWASCQARSERERSESSRSAWSTGPVPGAASGMSHHYPRAVM